MSEVNVFDPYRKLFYLSECRCSLEPNSAEVPAYCGLWQSATSPWCILSRGEFAVSCPGAVKSIKGNFYWTEDTQICEKAEKERGIGK